MTFRQKRKVKCCSRCKKVPVAKLWVCRDCGAYCCAHLCSLKCERSAACSSCLRKIWTTP
jgi:hypothetical protein